MRNRKNLGTMVVLIKRIGCMSYWKQVFSIFAIFLFLVGAGVVGVLWTQNPKHFPIRVIEIAEPLKQVSEDTFFKAVIPHLDKGFFWLDVQAMRASIGELSWVVSSQVRRLWPDKLEVSLKEHIPQARFGKTGVIDTEGRVFYPDLSTISEKWPLFIGPVPKIQEMLQRYLMALECLGPLGLRVAELRLTDYGAWDIMLDNGIALILGKTELDERLTRFVLVYKLSLQAQIANIAYVDCRYTNGLAIGYKPRI